MTGDGSAAGDEPARGDASPPPAVHQHAGDHTRLDTGRAARTGDPEVVYAEGKTPDQVVEILTALHRAHPDRAARATRLSVQAEAAVRERLPDAVVDPVARAVTVGPLPAPRG